MSELAVPQSHQDGKVLDAAWAAELDEIAPVVEQDAQIIVFPLAPGREFNNAVIAHMATMQPQFYNRFRNRTP